MGLGGGAVYKRNKQLASFQSHQKQQVGLREKRERERERKTAEIHFLKALVMQIHPWCSWLWTRPIPVLFSQGVLISHHAESYFNRTMWIEKQSKSEREQDKARVQRECRESLSRRQIRQAKSTKTSRDEALDLTLTLPSRAPSAQPQSSALLNPLCGILINMCLFVLCREGDQKSDV